MEKEIVIFDGRRYKRQKRIANFLRGVGFGLISFSISLFLAQYYPLAKMEMAYRFNRNPSRQEQKNNHEKEISNRQEPLSFSGIIERFFPIDDTQNRSQ